MADFPEKDFYKQSEVCQLTDTQPYVLRFWESEFPQLAPSRGPSGQLVYRREDLDLVLRIKQLLYDEEVSVADARERLARERNGATRRRRRPRVEAVEVESAPAPAPPIETITRERYQDAVDEIERLRLELRETEMRERKLAAALERAEAELDSRRERASRASAEIERVLLELAKRDVAEGGPAS